MGSTGRGDWRRSVGWSFGLGWGREARLSGSNLPEPDLGLAALSSNSVRVARSGGVSQNRTSEARLTLPELCTSGRYSGRSSHQRVTGRVSRADTLQRDVPGGLARTISPRLDPGEFLPDSKTNLCAVLHHENTQALTIRATFNTHTSGWGASWWAPAISAARLDQRVTGRVSRADTLQRDVPGGLARTISPRLDPGEFLPDSKTNLCAVLHENTQALTIRATSNTHTSGWGASWWAPAISAARLDKRKTTPPNDKVAPVAVSCQPRGRGSLCTKSSIP